MKILLVDDNLNFLKYTARFLTSKGYEVVTATSGEAALLILIEQSVNIIITDLKMPSMSGIDLIHKLQEIQNSTIVLIITGYGTISTAIEALKAGAYDFLTKPYQPAELLTKLEEITEEIKVRNSLEIYPDLDQEPIHMTSNFHIHDFPQPILMFTDDQHLSNSLGIPETDRILIDYRERDARTISPVKIHKIEKQLRHFMTTHSQGTIIFQGIEAFFDSHLWINFEKIMHFLHSQFKDLSQFSINFIIDKSHQFWTPSTEKQFYETITLLSGSRRIKSICEALSHHLRRDILLLLEKVQKINFNKIAKDLKIHNTSNLAFHLKRLITDSLLARDNSNYILTSRGLYFVAILHLLDKIDIADPYSPVNVLYLPQHASK